MPLYVKDREVGELADRLAKLKKTSKTEAVRQALRSELERNSTTEPKPPKIDAQTQAYVDNGLNVARAIRARYPAGGQGLPVTKEWIDSLYEDD